MCVQVDKRRGDGIKGERRTDGVWVVQEEGMCMEKGVGLASWGGRKDGSTWESKWSKTGRVGLVSCKKDVLVMREGTVRCGFPSVQRVEACLV